jgi:hypothetical protein
LLYNRNEDKDLPCQRAGSQNIFGAPASFIHIQYVS